MDKYRAAHEEWAEEQERLAAQRVEVDQVDWAVHGRFVLGLRRVAGVDISSFPDGQHAVAAVVVLAFPSLEVIYERYVRFRLDVEYVPGFLGFREVPALAALLKDT